MCDTVTLKIHKERIYQKTAENTGRSDQLQEAAGNKTTTEGSKNAQLYIQVVFFRCSSAIGNHANNDSSNVVDLC